MPPPITPRGPLYAIMNRAGIIKVRLTFILTHEPPFLIVSSSYDNALITTVLVER